MEKLQKCSLLKNRVAYDRRHTVPLPEATALGSRLFWDGFSAGISANPSVSA